jgi:Zn-finger nucleic acid-binding protein
VCVGRLVPVAPGERRCAACGGAWLDPVAIARVFAVPPRDLSPEERRALRARFASRGEGPGPRARTCPACGGALTRRPATAAGVLWGEACDAHGVWLATEDRAALDEFLAAGGASLPGEPVRKKPIALLGSSGADGYGPAERRTRPAPRPVRPFGTSVPAGTATGEALPPDVPRVCPACSVPLGWTDAEGVAVLACASCRGRWVPAVSFRAVAAQRPDRPLVPVERARVRAKATAAPVPHDPRPPLLCPECRRTLQRRLMTPYGPVRVDLCRAHGVWFDAGELERWAEFVREGGMTLPPPPHAGHPPERLGDDASGGGLALLWLAMDVAGLFL